jgi:hypothetical protein
MSKAMAAVPREPDDRMGNRWSVGMQWNIRYMGKILKKSGLPSGRPGEGIACMTAKSKAVCSAIDGPG